MSTFRPEGIPARKILEDIYEKMRHKRTIKTALPIIAYAMNDGGRSFSPSDYRRFSHKIGSIDWKGIIYQNRNTMMGCYSQDTEVLTEEGWKYFYELKPNDKVATLHEDELVFQIPSKIFAYDYDGLMYQRRGKAFDLLVTPNHNLYVKLYNRKHPSKFHLETAQNLGNLNIKLKRDANWKGKNIEYFRIPEIKIEKDNFFTNGKCYFERKELLIPAPLWFKFIGIYLAEGSKWTDNHHFYKTIISTNFKDKNFQEIKETIISLANCLGRKMQISKKRDLIINSKQLFLAIKEIPLAREKYIPKFYKQFNPKLLLELLRGLVLGDGTRQRSGSFVYSTSSKQLADDVQEICLKAGLVSTISKPRTKISFINNRKVEGLEYRVCITKRKIITHAKKRRSQQLFQWIPYKGKVYCVNVPTHVIYIRRNGKATWCGNSIFSYFRNKALIIRGYPKIKYSEESRVLDQHAVVEEKVDGTNLGIWLMPDGTMMGKTRMVEFWDSAGYKGRNWKLLFYRTGQADKLEKLLKEDYMVFGELYGTDNEGEFVRYYIPIGFKIFEVCDMRNFSFIPFNQKMALIQKYELESVGKIWEGTLTAKEVERLEFQAKDYLKQDGMEGFVAKWYDEGNKDTHMTKLKCKEIQELAWSLTGGTKIPRAIVSKAVRKAYENQINLHSMDEIVEFVRQELLEEADPSLVESSTDEIKHTINAVFSVNADNKQIWEYMDELKNRGIDLNNKNKVLSMMSTPFKGWTGNILYRAYCSYMAGRTGE